MIRVCPSRSPIPCATQCGRPGRTVSYLEASDEGHGFAKKPNADFQFLATIEFLRKHLLEWSTFSPQ